MASDARNKHERHDWTLSPFALMRQGIDEMDRWFSRITGDRSMAPWGASHAGGWMSNVPARAGSWMAAATGQGDWSPVIEAFQRGNEFVVRAEVPGMKRSEITVEAGDEMLTIRGERRQEQREDRDGLFWTERSYGTFMRQVPLPQGAITDSAKATFNNGILEVVMQAPSPEARRGRRIDISGPGGDTERK